MASPSMVRIPAGVYRPFFKRTTAAGAAVAPSVKAIAVPAFELDAAPVTREQYLAFVCRHPEWRKSQVKALFAEPTYLADWSSDLQPGEERKHEPVTHVSWFAARAYCAARDARLPTVVEWERVAGQSTSGATPAQAARDARTPFRFAMGHAAHDLSSQRLEFPGLWEWNGDFNSSQLTGSSLFCGDGYRSNDARDYAAFLRHSFRSSLHANYALKNLGFRCAKGE